MNPKPGRRLIVAYGRPLLGCVAFALASLWLLLVGQNSLRYEGNFSTDSVFYVDAARHIAEGAGAVSGITTVEEAIEADAFPPSPLRMWAPGYPYAIAATMTMGLSGPHGALLVSILAAGGCLIGAAWLGWALRGVDGAVLAVSFAAQWPLLRYVAIHGWSESLALAWLLMTLAAAVHCLRVPRSYLAAAGGFAAAMAVSTRYAVVPVAVLPVAAYLLRYRSKQGVVFSACHIASLALGLGAVWMISGWSPGGAGPHERPEWSSPLVHITDLAAAVWGNAAPTSALGMIVAAALLVTCLVGWRHRAGTDAVATAARGICVSGVWLVLAWSLAYGGALVYAAVRYQLDPIDSRLAAPLILPLLVLVAAVLGCSARLTRAIPVTTAILLLLIAIYSEWMALRPLLKMAVTRPYEIERRFERSETLQWLDNALQPDDVVITLDSLEVPFVLGTVRTLLWQSKPDDESEALAAQFTAFLDRHPGDVGRLFVVMGKGMGAATALPSWLPPPSGDGYRTVPVVDLEDGTIFEIVP